MLNSFSARSPISQQRSLKSSSFMLRMSWKQKSSPRGCTVKPTLSLICCQWRSFMPSFLKYY